MSKKLDAIYLKVCQLAGIPANAKEKDKSAIIIKALKKIKRTEKQTKNSHIAIKKRIGNILKVVEAYAKLDLSKKAFIGSSGDHFDALATGINMLGEELQSSTVSLNEKEVLLQEVHHRVKNNLQIITSLLSLQTEQITDQKLLNLFADNRRRIRSMALVHETLYRSKNLSKVNFADYVESLVDSVKDAYDQKNTSLHFDVETHELKIDTAIPCGLIINELITNSLKYAFKDKPSGEIRLKFKRNRIGAKWGDYSLTISDNGIGLPKDLDRKNPSSLGLQLVTILTEQLDGKLKIVNRKGVSFNITFPE